MEKDIIILNNLYKTLLMGEIGLSEVKDRIIDQTLQKTVIDAIKKYKSYNLIITNMLQKYDQEPKDINTFIKMSNELFTDIKLINSDDEKIAKMLIEGTNKGIINIQEIKNNEIIIDEKIKNIVLELLNLFEYQINNWKQYL